MAAFSSTATRHIAILSGGHLCHNPRVVKEAVTLASAGYRVEVLGGWIDPTLKARDEQLAARLRIDFRPVIDWTAPGIVGQLHRFWCRIRMKLGHLACKILDRQNVWQLGYDAPELLAAARRSDAELFIAHLEQALWVAERLRQRGARVAVDMEDWFSEDLPQDARKQRPVKLLRALEEKLLPRVAYSSCPSRAMSEALAAEYACCPPTVVYNAFAWSDRQKLDGQVKDRKDKDLPSLHWYSQTLGHGRGLEDLFRALPLVKTKMEIHLRGNLAEADRAWLHSLIPPAWRSLIFTHPIVSNEELLSRISEHDIGFAGEMKHCRSRDLTVTNKIIHYLLGGLAVVASDTAGQQEVAKQASGAVRLYPSGDAQSLAEQLNYLLASPVELQAAKATALIAAEGTFCWEHQVPTLLQSVERALAR